MRTYSKIGILGGSFNPIHFGHAAAAQMATEELGLDLALFIPTRLNPLKDSSKIAAVKDRLAMCECAISKNPLFEIWEKELEMPAPSYTVNTLDRLFTEFSAKEWYFIIGSDNLSSFVQWYKWEEILQKVNIAVCYRPNFPMDIPKELPNERVACFEGPNWGISSSQIRKRISERKSCKYLLDENVIKYIEKNRLYEESET